MSEIRRKFNGVSANLKLPKHIQEMTFTAPPHVDMTVPNWFYAMPKYRVNNALAEAEAMYESQKEQTLDEFGNSLRLKTHPLNCQPAEGEKVERQEYYTITVNVPTFHPDTKTYDVTNTNPVEVIYEALYYNTEEMTEMLPGEFVYSPKQVFASKDPIVNHFRKHYESLLDISRQAKISEKFVEEINSYSSDDEPLVMWEHRQRGAYQMAIMKGVAMLAAVAKKKNPGASADFLYNEDDIGKLITYFNLDWHFQPTKNGVNSEVLINHGSESDVSPNLETDLLLKIEEELTSSPFVDASGQKVAIPEEAEWLVEKITEMIDDIRLSKYYTHYVAWVYDPNEKGQHARNQAIKKVAVMAYESVCPPPDIQEIDSTKRWAYVMEWESGGDCFWLDVSNPFLQKTVERPELDLYEIKQLKNPLNSPSVFFSLLQSGIDPYEVFETPLNLRIPTKDVRDEWKKYVEMSGNPSGIQEPNWEEYEAKEKSIRDSLKEKGEEQ